MDVENRRKKEKRRMKNEFKACCFDNLHSTEAPSEQTVIIIKTAALYVSHDFSTAVPFTNNKCFTLLQHITIKRHVAASNYYKPKSI